MNFSIVIPLFNESENINILFKEIAKEIDFIDYHKFEIILVNDCSNDNTFEVISEIEKNNTKFVKIINNIENSGQSRSILFGVLASNYENIITLDGDMQNDPKDIKKLINVYCSDKNITLIGGIRKKRKDSYLKIFSSLIANKFRGSILKDGCSDTGCGLKIFNKNIFLAFPFFDGIHRFLPALFSGYKQNTFFIEVNHRPRFKGNSNYGTIKRLLKGLFDTYRVYNIIRKKTW